MQRLSAAGGTLAKLSFTVSRVVDVDAWAAEGEKLFDKRGGPFKGIGSLARETHDMLVEAWKTGGSAEIAAAMNAFRAKHTEAFIENAPYLRTDAANYRPWSRRFAQWLYSTKHITIEYRIKYDGIGRRSRAAAFRSFLRHTISWQCQGAGIACSKPFLHHTPTWL
jgi:hypothetical protein